MKLINFSRALCLSPHPDDVEISMMGSILMNRNTQFDILCLTKGGAKGLDNTNKLNRREEVDQVWGSVEAPNVTLIHSKFDYFEDTTEPGWINYIEKNFIEKTPYDALFIPTETDSMLEHRLVNRLGPPLCRKRSTLSKSPLSLIEYYAPSTLNAWTPNLFINISEYLDIKIKALSYLTSQIAKNNGYLDESVLRSFHCNYQCSKKGWHHVEQFKIVEIFGNIL